MKIALTGGGTLGHVLPALSLSDEIVKIQDADFLYIGSCNKKEAEAVEKKGIRFYAISTGKLRRYFSLKNLTDVARVFKGYLSAKRILKRERPDVLFSKGGFVSVPVVVAAHSLKIPVVTHESDFSLGLANRINARFASFVCLGFDTKLVDGKKYIYTGNPLRRDILEIRDKKIEVEKDLILVLGGSQGSAEVNNLVYANLNELCPKYRIIHQCGRQGDFSIRCDNYSQREFIGDELPQLMKRAKVIVSRSGAGAVGEICALGKCSLLVPLASATRGDQVENAACLEERGAAKVLREATDFAGVLSFLMENDKIRESIENEAFKLAALDAGGRIAEIVIESGMKIR